MAELVLLPSSLPSIWSGTQAEAWYRGLLLSRGGNKTHNGPIRWKPRMLLGGWEQCPLAPEGQQGGKLLSCCWPLCGSDEEGHRESSIDTQRWAQGGGGHADRELTWPQSPEGHPPLPSQCVFLSEPHCLRLYCLGPLHFIAFLSKVFRATVFWLPRIQLKGWHQALVQDTWHCSWSFALVPCSSRFTLSVTSTHSWPRRASRHLCFDVTGKVSQPRTARPSFLLQ